MTKKEIYERDLALWVAAQEEANALRIKKDKSWRAFVAEKPEKKVAEAAK